MSCLVGKMSHVDVYNTYIAMSNLGVKSPGKGLP